MWTNAGIGDVWGPNPSTNGNYTNAAWGESAEETAELKKKLQRSKAENAELQRQITQFEVQLLTAQVMDADIDDSDIPQIVAELGRQNQELKNAAKQNEQRIASLKEEIATLRKQLDENRSKPVESERNSAQIDDLQKYIRGQAKEYIEGKAEWSKQVAEMKHDLEQKLDQMRRDKLEAQRMHERELQLLQPRKDTTEAITDPADYERLYDELRSKLDVSEARVHELETYIRGNSTKAPKDIRDVLIHTSFDLKKSASELSALRKLHQQSVEFWEQNCTRLISVLRKHVDVKKLEYYMEHMLQTSNTGASSSGVMTLASSHANNASELVHAVVADLHRLVQTSEHREAGAPKSESVMKSMAEVAFTGTPEILGRHAAIQKNLDDLKLFRKQIAGTAMTIEKGLRSMTKDLRPAISELLAVEPMTHYDISLEAVIGQALSESAVVLPLDETKQRKALCTLRRVEYLSGSLCASFVELPELLKKLFDLTKSVVSQDEVNNLLRDVQEVQCSAKTAENGHQFHVSLLEKRFETISKRWSRMRPAHNKLIDRRVSSSPALRELGAECSLSSRGLPKDSSDRHMDVERAEIKTILNQPNSKDQLVKLRTDATEQSEVIQKLMARLDELEQHVVELHVSRYLEHNKHMDMSALLMRQAVHAPRPGPPQPQLEHPQRRRTRNARDPGSQTGARNAHKRGQRRS